MPAMIKHIYNKAWASRGEYRSYRSTARHIVDQMKPIIDSEAFVVWFYRKSRHIFLSLPEVNQVFQYLDANSIGGARSNFSGINSER